MKCVPQAEDKWPSEAVLAIFCQLLNAPIQDLSMDFVAADLAFGHRHFEGPPLSTCRLCISRYGTDSTNAQTALP